MYWARPVPGFGDPKARVLILGLAPAAHGANRTGRVFTGDGVGASGDFLMAALKRAGFANIATSQRVDDGLPLTDARLPAGGVAERLGFREVARGQAHVAAAGALGRLRVGGCFARSRGQEGGREARFGDRDLRMTGTEGARQARLHGREAHRGLPPLPPQQIAIGEDFEGLRGGQVPVDAGLHGGVVGGGGGPRRATVPAEAFVGEGQPGLDPGPAQHVRTLDLRQDGGRPLEEQVGSPPGPRTAGRCGPGPPGDGREKDAAVPVRSPRW